MKFFKGFSQKLYLEFWLKPPTLINIAHMLKQVAIYLWKPPFQKESLKSFAINLHNPNKINK